MKREVETLLGYLISHKKFSSAQTVIDLVSAQYPDLNIKTANFPNKDFVVIDLLELEALVNSKKFDFPEPDLGLIGVDNGKSI